MEPLNIRIELFLVPGDKIRYWLSTFVSKYPQDMVQTHLKMEAEAK